MKPSLFLRTFTLLLGAVVCVALLSASVTQEVPRGSLHGVATMKENGKRLPKAWVTLLYMGGSGNDFDVSKYHRFRTDSNGEFHAASLPAGIYSVEAEAKAHAIKRHAIQIEEGKVNEIPAADLTLIPKDPELELYASQRVFMPGEKASFNINGFDNADSASVDCYKLDLNKIVAKGGLSTLLYSFSRPGNEGGSDPSKSATSTNKFDKKLTSKDIEGVFTEPIELPKLDEGFYYVTCHVGQQRRSTYLNISRIGLVTKTSGKDSLCFVTDLATGDPVKGATIEAPGQSGLQRIGSTDGSGLARVTVPSNTLKKALLLANYQSSQAVLDFDNEGGEKDQARIFIYSDRPIYRPGDTVQFKGIVRKLNGLAYSVPSSGQVEIELRDTDDIAVKKFMLPISARGTFTGSFASNSEDKPGVYSVHATYAGAEFTYYANLAAYRKPEFSIKVTPNRKFYIYGEKASATVKAEYYFGGPVVGAKVQVYVTRRPHYFYEDEYASEADDEESDEGSGYGGGYYEKEFQGEYNTEVEAVTNEKGEAVIPFDTKTEGDPEIPDYDLEYSVNASITDQSNKYFDGSGTVRVVRGDVKANVQTDRNIADPGDVVNAEVTVTREEDGAPVAGKDVTLIVGDEVWNDDKSNFETRATLTGRTDAKGVATIPVKVGTEGSLVIKSQVSDSSGHLVKSVSYIYVEGDRLFGPPAAKFELTLDKKSYKFGDKCKIMVQTDKPGGSALITVQAEKVLATYVVKLTKASTVVTIPVNRDYTPNVWVGAVAVKNKHLLEASSRLTVDTKEHDLTVTVTPDKPDYQPGDTANLTIKTTDSAGKPVPADLSVGVVDESIYAIKPDTTNIRRGFYPMRQDEVHTNFSFEEIYLDGGDKAGGDIPVRTKFLDTAEWKPSVETDANGVAHTSIKLPDNLTSWRATAIGITNSTMVGMSKVNFRAAKPLSVRLELPSFLVQQDTQKITAIITNDTGKDQVVNVRLDAQGVKVNGDLSSKVTVPAARPQAVTWEVQTPTSGEARFTAYAWTDGGDKDAEGRSLTVAAHGRLVLESHSGEITGNTSTDFTLTPNADPNSGRLLLTIVPSVGATIYQSLDSLIGFPYGCTEQTMSRFLPAVVMSSTLKQLNVGLRPDLQKKIPDIVANGYARLAKMQHSNGAWGWWEYDDADLYMTAYVMDGIKRAKDAGFPPDKVKEDEAVKWAKKQMTDAKLTDYNQRDFLYLCYSLSLYGAKDEVVAGLARVKAEGASDVALLALTYGQLGDVAKRDEALLRLHEMFKGQGEFITFHNRPWEYGAESAAFPLIALTTLMPQDPLIPKLVRSLIVSRTGDMWYSTRDTSQALIGLTDYMRLTHDTGQPLDVAIIVNGGAPRQVHFDPSLPFSSALKVTVPVSELKPGDNKVEFRPVGSAGPCFYSGELRQTEIADKLLPLRDNIGLMVTRSYFLLEPQKLENGSMELRPSKRSIDEVKTGDLVRVELTIASSVPREFIMIEDPIPSGCRIAEREYVDSNEEWMNWWSQTIVLDNRAAFFVRYLGKGTQKLSYTMRAEQIGLGHALPTTVSNMYDPAQTASGGENLLKVTE